MQDRDPHADQETIEQHVIEFGFFRIGGMACAPVQHMRIHQELKRQQNPCRGASILRAQVKRQGNEGKGK